MNTFQVTALLFAMQLAKNYMYVGVQLQTFCNWISMPYAHRLHMFNGFLFNVSYIFKTYGKHSKEDLKRLFFFKIYYRFD